MAAPSLHHEEHSGTAFLLGKGGQKAAYRCLCLVAHESSLCGVGGWAGSNFQQKSLIVTPGQKASETGRWQKAVFRS